MVVREPPSARLPPSLHFVKISLHFPKLFHGETGWPMTAFAQRG
jgi:hypothetical protein